MQQQSAHRSVSLLGLSVPCPVTHGAVDSSFCPLLGSIQHALDTTWLSDWDAHCAIVQQLLANSAACWQISALKIYLYIDIQVVGAKDLSHCGTLHGQACSAPYLSAYMQHHARPSRVLRLFSNLLVSGGADCYEERETCVDKACTHAMPAP